MRTQAVVTLAVVIATMGCAVPVSRADGSAVDAKASPKAAAPSVPPRGSAERRAMLDTVRRELKTEAVFRVQHIATLNGWGYFEGVEASGDFESDFFVRALLRQTRGQWRVEASWVLSRDEGKAYDAFVARLQKSVAAERLDPAVLSPGMRDALKR